MRHLILLALLGPFSLVAEERGAAVLAYAEHVEKSYGEAQATALLMQESIVEFAAEPTEETLGAAREAWIAARRPYLETEVFRFYSGPIDDEDGPEGLLNAWPLDERYIDNIIAGSDPITPASLTALNEREGEANISTGYHAIEYLLWGEDHAAESAGTRPASDFATADGAARRKEYLLAATALLIEHLTHLNSEWAGGSSRNYRGVFLGDAPDTSLKRILTGLSMLAGFEMASERLLVAYDTQAQEDEHSCFSDTTHIDILHDLIGIQEVWAILAPLAATEAPELAEKLTVSTAETVRLAKEIPVPFDQAILGDDSAAGRVAILALVEALEDQADLLDEVTQILVP
jgi:putative iron-regulated protein